MNDDLEFIIHLPGVPAMGPINLGDFVRTAKYDGHVYKGRAFPIREFNSLVPAVLDAASHQSFAVQPVPKIIFPQPSTNPAPSKKAVPKPKSSS